MLSEDSVDEPEPPEDHVSRDDNDDDDAIDGDSNPGEEFVELDPTGRYGRYAEVLGKGATKTVYKAYDMVDCKEVAWNKAPNRQGKRSMDEALAIEREVSLLQNLNYKGIVKLYKAWVDEIAGVSNFITELCSSTLLAFRRKHKHVSRKAVKSWARQILEGLVYLHKQDPPIIHRDLKCENILVKSCSSTTLKIGDFGCAAILDETHHMHTMVGTPEFMAPEMFQEDYNELVDVYSFGMCMLELLTRECPYSECASLAQVYKRVVAGEKPESLLKVKDVEAVQFINRCLLPASQRPLAKELLEDPFLRHKGATVDSSKDSSIKDFNPIQALTCLATRVPGSLLFSDGEASNAAVSCWCEEERTGGPTETNLKVIHWDSVPKDARSEFVHKDVPCAAMERFRRWRYQVLGAKEDDNTLSLKIRIQESGGCSSVVFPFDLKNDSAQTVAEEMVHVLNYPQSDLPIITDLVSEELAVVAVNAKENFAHPTCSGNAKGLLIKEQQTENWLVGAVSSCNTSIIESNPPSEEAVVGSGKGCCEMAALVTDEGRNPPSEEADIVSRKGCFEMPASVTDGASNRNFHGHNSAAGSSNFMENESSEELPENCTSVAVESAELPSSDERMGCCSPKRSSAFHLKSSIAAYKRRLRLLLSKNPPLNLKHATKFPQKPPPSDRGVRRWLLSYIHTLT